MIKFIKALSVFAGTIIGVGIFGLPYVASRAGFFVVLFYFFLMTGVTIAIHLVFGKVALGTETLHRLPGYAGEYLGNKWKKISFLVLGSGLTGALLAYLIVGGEFLKLFFAPYFGGNFLIYTLIFFGAGTYLIFRGIKSIAQTEMILLAVFLAIVVLIFVKAYSFINLSYLKNIDLKSFALPYGVVLFSLWGSAIVPEIKEMLKGDWKLLRKVIISGILLAAITYLFFIFIVFGASGVNTSKEAISGLAYTLGDNIVRLGLIFGVITCFTSFLTLGLTLKKIFLYDFGLSSKLSWFIACFFPLFLFLIGLREFIDIIGLTGAVAIGCEGIILVFLYREFLKKKLSQKMNPLFYILPIIFVLGVFFEILYFIIR